MTHVGFRRSRKAATEQLCSHEINREWALGSPTRGPPHSLLDTSDALPSHMADHVSDCGIGRMGHAEIERKGILSSNCRSLEFGASNTSTSGPRPGPPA